MSGDYKMNTYRTIRNICEGLIAKYDHNDPDYKAAEAIGAFDSIIDLFADYYDAESFLEFLEKHDGDILSDFRFAYIKEWDELIADIKYFEGDCDGVYDIDFEEFKNLETEEEQIKYIKDHLDCLMVYDNGVVVSW